MWLVLSHRLLGDRPLSGVPIIFCACSKGRPAAVLSAHNEVFHDVADRRPRHGFLDSRNPPSEAEKK